MSSFSSLSFSQSYIVDFSLIFETIATAPAPLSVSLPLSSLSRSDGVAAFGAARFAVGLDAVDAPHLSDDDVAKEFQVCDRVCVCIAPDGWLADQRDGDKSFCVCRPRAADDCQYSIRFHRPAKNPKSRLIPNRA
jgi:hypothetical protein